MSVLSGLVLNEPTQYSITGANQVVGLVFPHREAPTRLLGSPSEVQHRAEHKFHVV
jgi:hypothetical protein